MHGSAGICPRKRWQNYNYNLDKQLTRITRPDGQLIDFTYDTAGKLDTMTQPSGTLDYAYDVTTGQLNQITTSDSVLSFSYDGFLPLNETWTGTISAALAEWAEEHDIELDLSSRENRRRTRMWSDSIGPTAMKA